MTTDRPRQRSTTRPSTSRPRSDSPRREGEGFRKERSFGDRPRGDSPRGDRPYSDRPRSDRPRRDGDSFRSERPRRDGEGFRKERSFGDRPRGDAPRGDRPYSDRPRSDRPRRDGDSFRTERPRREGEGFRSDRPRSDRPRREGDGFRSERPRREGEGFRKERSFGDRPRGDAPRGDRPQGNRSYSDRPRSDSPRRDGDNFRSERPRREGEGFRNDRAPRKFDDRPRRDGDKPFNDRPRRDRDEGERSFDKKPFDKKPFGKKGRDDKDVKPRTLRARRREISEPQTQEEAADVLGIAFREAALNVVQAVLSENATLDLALSQYAKTLPERERRQAHALAAACIRYQHGLDEVLDKHMSQPFEALTVEKGLLRLGAAQILLLGGIPDHAAVSTTVLLAQKIDRDRVSGLINAVLRRIVGEKGRIKLQSSGEVPTWIRDILDADYGPKAEALMESLVGRAAVDFRLRDESLYAAAEAAGAIRLPFTRDGFRLPVDTRTDAIPALREGGAYVQDGAAQIPARLLAEHLQIAGDVVDLCAAPGGKTIQLLDYLPKRKVVAVDAWGDRLKLVDENLKLRGLKAELLESDARTTPFDDRSFAGVLVDAPCTATGTSRRHPEALHRKTPQELDTLRRIQQQMLREATRILKPGGVLVYATCSLFKDEGEKQIENLLKNDSRFTRLPVPADLKPFATKQGDVRTTPLDGVDGFFVSALRLG